MQARLAARKQALEARRDASSGAAESAEAAALQHEKPRGVLPVLELRGVLLALCGRGGCRGVLGLGPPCSGWWWPGAGEATPCGRKEGSWRCALVLPNPGRALLERDTDFCAST